MKHLLVCCDLSDDSLVAFEAAKTYASHFKDDHPHVTLLYVVDTPVSYVAPVGMGPGWTDLEPLVKEVEKRAKEKLSEIGAQFFPDIQAKVEVRRSVKAIYEEVLDAAASAGADLIVVAKHGKSGMQRFLMGSVTTKIVQLASCPVLVVPIPHAAKEKSA